MLLKIYIYGSIEDASDIHSQFAQFLCGQGVFGLHAALRDRHGNKNPIDLWWLHGVDALSCRHFPYNYS
jgi:hypothetical protein